jgi:hypothetical protein
MTPTKYRSLERTRQPNFGGLAARWDADVMIIGASDNRDAEVHSGAGAK